MAWWSGGEQEAGKAKVEACEKELGCTINATYVPYDEYLSKLNTLAAAGQLPDVFALPEGNVFDWGSQGMLMDLAPEYAAAGVDIDSTYVKPSIFRDSDQHVCELPEILQLKPQITSFFAVSGSFFCFSLPLLASCP
jgi:multiple sugar transport system substrate-binding protein